MKSQWKEPRFLRKSFNTMTLQQWIDDRLKYIAELLPQLQHEDPASFACGYNAGYKHALLELVDFLDEEITE